MRTNLEQLSRRKPGRFPMNDDVNSESSSAAPEDASKSGAAGKPKAARAKKSATEGKQSAAKKQSAGTRTRKAGTKKEEAEPAVKAAPKKKASSRRKATVTDVAVEPVEATAGVAAPFEDPIGDVSDGEAQTYTGEALESDAESEAEAYRAGVAVDAVDGTLESREPSSEEGAEDEFAAKPVKIAEDAARGRAREDSFDTSPPAKLDRLQKILSQAGIASRRHAEEMIVAGRVEVNGQVVTTLGSKADPGRDHIRVDGKLLHGAERHRYFVLNKPKGYVTTVSDPEGRPTVMDFVQKLGERVYPVGRLDFQSEGLLLMTNDGALANQLTRASSGVEKTYLVKVAGQPDEEQLERLRSGVMIERGGPTDSELYGAGGRVRTAPARIRQIRQGENPWFEVVLTEGRNRELRKMFSAIGHYVEKIRRVGYGPLVLDMEPGKLRELTLEEVDLLRQVSEGKLKPRRLKSEAMLPKEAGRAAEARPAKPYGKRGQERSGEKEFGPRSAQQLGAKDFRGEREERFGAKERPPREFRGERREWQTRPQRERTGWSRPEAPGRGFEQPRRERGSESERRDFRGQSGRGFVRGGGGKPLGGEDRGGEGQGRERFGASPKFGGKGKPGGFGGGSGQGGFSAKGKVGGFGGGRVQGGFSAKGKSSGFSSQRRQGGFSATEKPGGFSSGRGQGGFSAKGKTGGFSGGRGGRASGRFTGKGTPGGFRKGPRPSGGRTDGRRRG